MMYKFVLLKSVTVTGVSYGSCHISHVSSNRVWISDCNNLILTNTTGDELFQLRDLLSDALGGHSVNTNSDLIYINSSHNINKLSTNNKVNTTFIKYTPPWRPQCVYSSPSTGDLLVGMWNTDIRTGKVVRYNSVGENIQTIQRDNNTGQDLYSRPLYITENRNGDVIVSDFLHAVVVTDCEGRPRFSYTGYPPESVLSPLGICTNALLHILVCDANTKSVQMLDRDGNFLSLIKTSPYGMYGPQGLSYDDKTDLLWVGSVDNNTVSIYRIVNGDILAGPSELNMNCKNHPTNTAVNFCMDCGFPLCVECTISKEHNSHNVIQIQSRKDAGKEKRTGSDFSDDTIKLNFNLAQQQHGEKQTTVPYDVESFMHKKYIETKLITSKCEEEIKIGKISGRTPLQTKQTELSSFSKKLEQLRKTGEASMRIKKLIDSLNIEQTYSQKYQRGQRKTNEYEDIIKGVDYLDCSDFDLSSDEKQLQGSEPFLQVYFDEDLGWMINCAEVFRKVQSAKCRYILSILFAAHIKEQISEFQPKNIPLIIDCCMDYAIKNENHIFILELVRRYIFAFDFNLQTRFEGRKINSVVIETLLQAAKCMILRRCPRLRQNAISLSFCYKFSKESRLVMMMSYKGSIEMKDGIPEKAMGVDLILYNYTQPSDEAYTVFNSFMASSAINLPLIAEKEARKLFKKHSNLTLISASPFKSTGYLTGKHRVVEKLCISLLCLHKGFIPIGEKEFPKVINGHDVDVQEGYCSLGSGRSIDFGGHIRRARGINTPGHGSIGGFVDLPNNAVGLITCAHVVFSSDELIIPNSEMHNIVLGKGIDLNVEFFDKNQHNFQVCGTIIDKCFPLSSNNNSVDAALIKLDPTVNEFGFPVTDQLYSAGFDPNYPPIFSGEVVNVPDPDPVFKVSNRIPDKSDSVVKYGSKTKFTIGNLYFNGAHIRFVDDTGYLPDKTIAVMCNQIEIQSLPHGTFFEPGDSGAFVFCINPDKTLSCIGMAIGSTTKGSCFVTPMTRILDSFGRPHRLKPCSPLTSVNTSTVSDNPLSSELASQSNATSDINLGEILLKLQTSITGMQSSISDVQNQQRNIQSSLQSMQTDVGNLKTEVGNLKTEVQAEFGNLRTDVQREVGNLRMEVQVENENLRTQVQTEVGYLKTQVQEIKEEFQIRSTGSSPDINQN